MAERDLEPKSTGGFETPQPVWDLARETDEAAVEGTEATMENGPDGTYWRSDSGTPKPEHSGSVATLQLDVPGEEEGPDWSSASGEPMPEHSGSVGTLEFVVPVEQVDHDKAHDEFHDKDRELAEKVDKLETRRARKIGALAALGVHFENGDISRGVFDSASEEIRNSVAEIDTKLARKYDKAEQASDRSEHVKSTLDGLRDRSS